MATTAEAAAATSTEGKEKKKRRKPSGVGLIDSHCVSSVIIEN